MKIRAIREAAGISQKLLAERADITPAYLCGLESGKRNNPGIAIIRRIANALNVPIDDLLDKQAS